MWTEIDFIDKLEAFDIWCNYACQLYQHIGWLWVGVIKLVLAATVVSEAHFTSDFCNNLNSTETLSVIQFLSIWSLELWHESIAIMIYAVFYGDHLDENRTKFLLHSSYGENLQWNVP